MSLRAELTKEVATIFADQWNVRDGRIVPDPEDIQHRNHASQLDAVVLYADLSYSTLMVDSEPFYLAAEVYKSYLHCSARIIKANGGVITAYDGDRIMAVYVGDSKTMAWQERSERRRSSIVLGSQSGCSPFLLRGIQTCSNRLSSLVRRYRRRLSKINRLISFYDLPPRQENELACRVRLELGNGTGAGCTTFDPRSA